MSEPNPQLKMDGGDEMVARWNSGAVIGAMLAARSKGGDV